MNEQAKIDEAERNLQKLSVRGNDRINFLDNLSAFLSSARSVLQYARKEAKTKSGGRGWYDAQVTVHAVVKFFKDERDRNIHERRVSADAHVNLDAGEQVSLSDSVVIAALRADGTIETTESLSSSPSSPKQPAVIVTREYFFPDWPGMDIVTLCGIYLAELKRIVADGIKNGFLTR